MMKKNPVLITACPIQTSPIFSVQRWTQFTDNVRSWFTFRMYVLWWRASSTTSYNCKLVKPLITWKCIGICVYFQFLWQNLVLLVRHWKNWIINWKLKWYICYCKPNFRHYIANSSINGFKKLIAQSALNYWFTSPNKLLQSSML